MSERPGGSSRVSVRATRRTGRARPAGAGSSRAGSARAGSSRAWPAAGSPRAWPWWAQAVAVFAAGRAVSAVILIVISRFQAENGWTTAKPSYLSYVGRMWDASWYEQIAYQGYPASLPIGADGVVQQNAWAFFPLFPGIVRALDVVTRLGWDVLAPTVALVAGAGAAVVIHRLVSVAGSRAVERRPGLPLATVAVVSFFPAAPVLQVAYTESLALLLVAGSLLLLARRRYEWAGVLVVVLGLTRGVALPIAAAVGWHLFRRFREGGLPTRDLARGAGLTGVAVVAGFAWPGICAWVIGDPQAYLRTQAAWRGGGGIVPVRPWFDVSQWLLGSWGPWLLVLIAAATAAMVLSPVARRLGPEMQAWSGAYLAYLVVTMPLTTSMIRYLLLAFPLGAVSVGWTRSRIWLWILLIGFVAGQAWWVWGLWRLTPPSGWPP